jgi:hypothetical protein
MRAPSKTGRVILLAVAIAIGFSAFAQPADAVLYQLYRDNSGNYMCSGHCLGAGYVCCEIVPVVM